MLDRRTFLKLAAAAGSTAALQPMTALASRYQDSSGYFGVHEFIENNPNAVFIMRTDVDTKLNHDAIKQAGTDFGRSVFVPKSQAEGGVPLTHLIPIKPNLTQRGDWQSRRTTFDGDNVETFDVEQSMGIVTDTYFVEGIIESMKELGLSGSQFHLREANGSWQFSLAGYPDMCERTGANIKSCEGSVSSSTNENVVWSDVPDGAFFNKMAHIWPVNAPDSFLLNIAKFKAHEMGLTLAAKNLQGSCFSPYQTHCRAWNQTSTWGINQSHIQEGALDTIQENALRRAADGVPRWDKPGYDKESGLGQETWAARNVDNNITTVPGLHIIEGVYGRDGDFLYGPNEPFYDDDYVGMAQDYMTNIIIFGKNPYYMDIIGHWLGGHEPGNMGLFHVARERGLINTINPADIPVYEWTPDGSAVQTAYDSFQRWELKSLYLRRNYDGQEEPFWHLINEPFDYGAAVKVDDSPSKPQAMVLGQNTPNPFNPTTSIEFKLPVSGHVRVEVYNLSGQLVDVLVDGYRTPGSHMAVWNTTNHASGTYFYRMLFKGHSETRKMTLLK